MLGFPPKKVDTADDSKQLGGLNFRSGDTLIVEEDAALRAKVESQKSERMMEELQAQFGAQGFLTRKVVPANNSCLFTSINFVLEGGKLDLSSAGPLRQIIAGVVA